MASDCGTYELVVDLRGEIVAAGEGFATLCQSTPEALLGRPITRVLRGPALTAPYGQTAKVTVKSPQGDRPAVALRVLTRDHIYFTVLPRSRDLERSVARDEAQHLHEVERLVHRVCRDIQNPLTGIIGFASLTRLAATPHRRRYCLDQVTTQAQRCSRLIATLDAGVLRRTPMASTIDAREPSSRAVSNLRLQLEAHGICVDLVVPPAPVWVSSDESLLANAIACFIERGTLAMRAEFQAREVTISCRPADGELRPAVRMAFTGCEITGERLTDRFDPREPSGLKSGPTLNEAEFRTTCERLRQLGATLEIATSSDDEEVIVTLELPAAAAPPPIDHTRTPVPLDILAIDDDAMMGELYSEALGISGHSVTKCRSLHSAREALRTQRFDAVISDFFLGDGTLPELWAEAASRHPSLGERLVLVTSQASHPEVREWLARGGPPVLTKPFTPAALLSRVTEVTS